MQIGVGSAHPGNGLPPREGVEVNHLGGGVHSGVGAACGNHVHRRIGETRERLLEMILHAAAGRLCLPAAERGPVVLEAERDTQLRARR